ncbi:MAG: ABC transporter ATP-binding protein [Rhodospirillaceae bacterium]|jgi:oligopeptide/dipeptide ABC transporter ATP-binding protein|nr:ABC transporter ATP-binding protein [Rhodospirillaceae bacterium]MBT6203827.1 ABC transporter ATP-binding protein [Rhodospirillaceae bacterium]MBT6510891.1 ABC transporter ATP-binding protein [Rhodospirillaceae bacterium]MBT7612383.1 ABC transporter ATP-binding protein [Rhodospirillaceae bacterium]MBT7648132.1 ABC transporter ATP-binding protein [Rhodospirillaceae bacterium]
MPDLLNADKVRVRFRTSGLVQTLMKGLDDPFIDAVMHVSFSLQAGETFGLVGESGSGKTTLGRAIIGLVQAQEGSIKFQGDELIGLKDKQYKEFRREIAMMFQDPIASLSPRKTVRYSITEPFRIHGVTGKDLGEEARRLLRLVGLHEGFMGAYPHQLSGGQARRVGVARALALEPKVIIADEPTAGLDVSVQGEILNLMNRLQREMGLSYLIITHNLPVVRHVSDRLAIMYLGRFVETGTTKEIFERPAHPYTLGLLAAVPEPDPDKRRDKLELEGEIPSLMNRPKGCEFHTRCPFAQAKCLAEAPEYKEVSPGHWASCHFPFPDPADAKAVGIRAMPETGSAPKVDDKALHAGSRDRF